MQSWMRPRDRPIRTLLCCFISWKILLLLIAAGSPGPGYDTSTSLILSVDGSSGGTRLPAALHYMVTRLTRWDAIYFVRIANRGYLFEQEWAFGWGFTRLIALCTTGLEKAGIPSYEGLEGVVAVIIAHLSHLFSVLVLFNLSLTVFPSASTGFALTTASFHIISPAGLFLSAPFAESSCAFLTLSGCLLFTKSFVAKGNATFIHDLLLLISGMFFGIATTFRSNGIFNGLLLLEEAFRTLLSLKSSCHISTIRRLLAAGLGGLSVAAGFLLPQYIAFMEYCGNADPQMSRPWCKHTLPSIYTFVQDHYWNVGLFRYWTLSNLPLFLLATPMISIMLISGVQTLTHNITGVQDAIQKSDVAKTPTSREKELHRFPLLRNLAVSQLLLTLITLTTAHVQIITRISSAYPVWLWYLATLSVGKHASLLGNSVRCMTMYALVQGGLFSSFLPPA